MKSISGLRLMDQNLVPTTDVKQIYLTLRPLCRCPLCERFSDHHHQVSEKQDTQYDAQKRLESQLQGVQYETLLVVDLLP
jgi:hypothetical protein